MKRSTLIRHTRDREKNKERFLPFMHKFLLSQSGLEYKIYFISQVN